MTAKLPVYNPDDVEPAHTPELRDIVARMVFAWSEMEAAVNVWLMEAFGMPPNETAIMIGNMDVKTKIEKIKTLYQHYSGASDPMVKTIAALATNNERAAKVRNTVVHSKLDGISKSEPEIAYFIQFRATKDQPNRMLVKCVPFSDIRLATRFATEMAQSIRDLPSKQPRRSSSGNNLGRRQTSR